MVVCSPSQPTWDITIHPPSGPSVLAGTLSFLQSMWDRPQIHPPLGPASLLALFPSSNQCGTAPKSTPLWGPTSLLAHRLMSTPFGEERGTARRLTHRPVSGSDTICNDSDPPLVDIVLFGLSLSGFPSRL